MIFDFKFPDVGEGIHEGKIVKWLVNVGDDVKADDPILEVETDKAVVEIPSPKSGKLSKVFHSVGDTVNVGEVIASIDVVDNSVEKNEEDGSVGVVGELENTSGAVMKAPDLSQSGAVFTGSSSQKSEELSNQNDDLDKRSGVNVVDSKFKAVKKYDMFGYIDHIKYDGVRKAIGDHMVKSVSSIPHVTHTDFADVTSLVELRNKEKVDAKDKGIHLTYLPYIIEAVIESLKEFPYLNASLDEVNNEIILKKYYNIAIAVDTEAGLMAPVIKGADAKDRLQIAKEISELAEKARNRSINKMDLKGSSFTITNIGSRGSGVFFSPIINYPEAGILGVGVIKDMPWVVDGEVKVRKIMPLSLSYDHRVLDGAMAAEFMKFLVGKLEGF